MANRADLFGNQHVEKALRKHTMRVSEPKFLLFKPLPRQEAVDSLGEFRAKCTIYNHIENVVCKYDANFITNNDEIRPETFDLFNFIGKRLSDKSVTKL